MAEEFQVIDDPEDPRLADTPATGSFDDLLEDDEPEVAVAPLEAGGGGFDDLIDRSEEARQTFRGKRGLVAQSLQDYGAAPVVQAALLGDIEQESSFNPTLDDHNDPTGAHGLLQIGNQMWSDYESFAARQGWSKDSPEFTYNQVPFVLDRFKSDQPARWEAMQGMKSAADVVEVFRGDPDWGYGIAGKRHSYADKYQSLLETGPITLNEGDFRPNSSFGDLVDEDGEGKPPALDFGDEDHPIVADQGQAEPDIEIPEFLKEPEEGEEEPAAAGVPRIRMPIQVGGSGEIPAAFQVKLHPPEFTEIPTTAAEPVPLIAGAEGAVQEVSPSEAGAVTAPPGLAPPTPLQQQFANMGQGVAGTGQDVVRGVVGAATSPPVKNLVGATGELVSEMVPHDLPTYAKSLGGPAAMAYDQARAFVQGDISSIPIAGRIPEIIEAAETPAYSKERFKVAEKVMMDMGIVKGAVVGAGGAGLRKGPKTKISGAAKAAAEAEAGQFAGLTKEQMNELQYGRGFTDVGPQRARSELQQVSPEVLLRRGLKAAQRAGKKGFARGSKEAKEAGKAEMRKQRQRLEKESREAARDIRETLRTADQWLDADLNTVLDKLKSFSMHLPLQERGKLNTAFARVMKKPPAWTRDPAVVKRRAERLLNRMAQMVYEVNKKRLVKDIDKGLDKIVKSPTVPLSEKRIAKVMRRTFEAFKDKMSLDMLEAMAQRMKEIEANGRQMFKNKEWIKKAQDIITQGEISTQGTLKADGPAQLTMPVGEIPTYWQRWRQAARNIPARWNHFKFALTPMDWQFLRFDGQGIFGGALTRNLKLPIDVRYSHFMDSLEAYQLRRNAIKEQYKLDKRNFNRIATHAELRQEGGAENLRAAGVSEADIKKYSNLGSLSKGERALLKVDDAINNELYPIIKEAFERDWNQDIGEKIQGYYPRIRNWEEYDTLSIEGRGEAHKRSRTERGFAEQRVKGAITKNMVDSDQIMNKHLEDVLYTINVGPEISRGANLVKQQWFKDQVGDAGQKVFADWYDTLARNGGVEQQRRIKVLDWTRKNVGVAQLAFRATTILLQPTALLNTMPFLSLGNTARGISTILFSREGRAWILKTFPEVRSSVRGMIDDPAFREYSGKVAHAGFTPIRIMDGFARMSGVEAAYRDALAKRGIPFDRNAVPHPEAVAEAQRLVRMTQASGLPKDAPQALSRGALTGNLSADKAILQFQNFIITRWSEVKYGAAELATGNPVTGAKVLSYTILATYVEQLGREGVANGIRAIFGAGSPQEVSRRTKEEETPLPLRVAKKAAIDMATSMPIVSNISGMARYDSSGIPVVDTLKETVEAGVAMSRGKPAGVIQGAQAVGAFAGVPTGQIGDILARIARSQGDEDYVGPYAPRTLGPGRSAPTRGGSGPGRTAPIRQGY